MRSAGEQLAGSALEKLLKRAESAWTRDAPIEASLPFTAASLSGYFNLPSAKEKDAAHAVLRNAERNGALAIEWDSRAGDNGQILRLQLQNAEALAQFLGRDPLWIVHAKALDALNAWMRYPNVAIILARWRAGKLVRSLGSDRVADFVDACRVVDACSADATTQDMPIRRLSARLFADSKRVERLGPALDVLTTESMDQPWRDDVEVFAALGLVKLPQPVLLAGTGTVELMDGSVLPIPRPYIGLAPQSIRAVRVASDARYLLTIENLTTFHELALGHGGEARGLILYTAGMPSPALLRIYRFCIEAGIAVPGFRRMHWGDIDLGGFRIAARLARAGDLPLQPWLMDPASIERAIPRKELAAAEVREIERLAGLLGWSDIAIHVLNTPQAIEQEQIQPSLP